MPNRIKEVIQLKKEVLLEKLGVEIKIRGYSNKTLDAYEWHTNRFFDYIKKDPKNVTKDDIKAYLAHLIDQGHQSRSRNIALCSLRFFFKEVLGKIDVVDIKSAKVGRKMPEYLTKEEVRALFNATNNLKHRLLLKMMYGSGLRVSECVGLKIGDIDLNEGRILVRSGKGNKDRRIRLANDIRNEFKNYLPTLKSQNFLFEGRDGHITVKLAQKVIKEAAVKAGIKKRVYCHILRSSYATHLHQSGVDSRTIQALLGHADLATTQMYTNVTKQVEEVRSPLDE
jgi:integrase/recombinase XerD